MNVSCMFSYFCFFLSLVKFVFLYFSFLSTIVWWFVFFCLYRAHIFFFFLTLISIFCICHASVNNVVCVLEAVISVFLTNADPSENRPSYPDLTRAGSGLKWAPSTLRPTVGYWFSCTQVLGFCLLPGCAGLVWHRPLEGLEGVV